MVHRMNLITSNAVSRVGRYFSTSCSTSASEQIKEITIENLTLVNGDIIGVTFSNENSYGDCTLTTPTYPTLKLNSGSAIPIYDSLGHTVGKGCWNSGDYIELRYCGDKFLIINSDVRQCINGDSGYTIYSNGFCRQYARFYSRDSDSKITFNYFFNLNVITSLFATVIYKGNNVLSTSWAVKYLIPQSKTEKTSAYIYSPTSDCNINFLVEGYI